MCERPEILYIWRPYASVFLGQKYYVLCTHMYSRPGWTMCPQCGLRKHGHDSLLTQSAQNPSNGTSEEWLRLPRPSVLLESAALAATPGRKDRDSRNEHMTRRSQHYVL